MSEYDLLFAALVESPTGKVKISVSKHENINSIRSGLGHARTRYEKNMRLLGNTVPTYEVKVFKDSKPNVLIVIVRQRKAEPTFTILED